MRQRVGDDDTVRAGKSRDDIGYGLKSAIASPARRAYGG
jgi:hypothetical protein